MAELFYYPRKTTCNATGGTHLNSLGLAGTETSRGCSVRRQRRARTLFTEDAVDRLEAVFVLDPYPDINLRENLAEDIGVSEARIQTWFQNKRSRTRRMMVQSSRDTSSPSAPAHLETPRPTPRRRLSLPAHRPSPAPPVRHSRSTPTVTPPTGGRTRRRTQEEGSRQGYKVVKLTDFRAEADNLVIDFSVRSDTDTDSSATSTPPGGPQLDSPAPSCESRYPEADRHPDADRPFFTPWATPTKTSSPCTSPPTSLRMLPSHAAFPNPWMYGYTPSFSQGGLYLQRLPSSPFLQHVADTSLVVSPGWSPLTARLLTPTQPAFIFPEVLSGNLTGAVRATSHALSPEDAGPAPSDLDSASSTSRDSDCHSPINVCD